MKYVECPQVYDGAGTSLFLAGGISRCGNWQKDLISRLEGEDLVIINPRRENFDVNDSEMEKRQIAWEYEHLEKADAVSFWFTPETICPITLYELGKISMTDKPLFVGVDPNYERKRDVEIQTGLVRPDVKIVYNLNDLSEQIRKWGR